MITTTKGMQRLARRVGSVAAEYYQTTDGLWWTQNPQKGFVEVPAHSRALQAALAESGMCP